MGERSTFRNFSSQHSMMLSLPLPQRRKKNIKRKYQKQTTTTTTKKKKKKKKKIPCPLFFSRVCPCPRTRLPTDVSPVVRHPTKNFRRKKKTTTPKNSIALPDGSSVFHYIPPPPPPSPLHSLPNHMHFSFFFSPLSLSSHKLPPPHEATPRPGDILGCSSAYAYSLLLSLASSSFACFDDGRSFIVVMPFFFFLLFIFLFLCSVFALCSFFFCALLALTPQVVREGAESEERRRAKRTTGGIERRAEQRRKKYIKTVRWNERVHGAYSLLFLLFKINCQWIQKKIPTNNRVRCSRRTNWDLC
eukprot:Rhum_TRINITY_DN15047_c5_g3::Rhum_TRINITY_DN15047_c5_g3_i1::g.136054::m.136054